MFIAVIMNTLASIFNLGGPDLIIIFVVLLLFFGAKKLPELARGLGQAMREFSKAKDEIEREVNRPPVQAAQQPAALAQSQGAAQAEAKTEQAAS